MFGYVPAITGSVPNTLANQANWTAVLESGVDMLALPAANGNSSDLSTWKEQKGGGNVVPASSGFAKRTFNGALEFNNDATERARLASVSISTGTDFAIVARMYTRGNIGDPFWIPISFDTNGTNGWRLYLTIGSGFVGVDIWDGTLNPTPSDNTGVSPEPFIVFVERTGTNIRLQVNNRTPVTTSSAVVVTALNNLTIGAHILSGGAPYGVNYGGVTDIAWKKDAAFTSSERTRLLNYFARRFRPWRIAGNVGLWEVRKKLVTSGGNVVTWSDAPGRTNRSFGLSESYTAPAYNASGTGDGVPSIDFAGGSDPNTTGNLLTLSGFSSFLDLDNPFTFAGVVYTPNDETNTGGLLGYGDYPTPGRYTWFQTSSMANFAQLLNDGASSIQNTANQSPGAGWHFVYGRRLWDGTFTQGFNGIAEQSMAVPGGTIAADILHLGGVIQSPGAYVTQCKWRGFAAFARDIGLAEVARLRSYWQLKYPLP